MKTNGMRKTKPILANRTNDAQEYCIIPSPLGELMLVADADVLTGLYFVGCKHIPAVSQHWKRNAEPPVLRLAGKQLQAYFSGQRKEFSIPLRLHGTDFQESVWQEIARIPFSETVSYSDLARRAGKPGAIRAAGTNTGLNPISIIVPCHRVVGKNGSLHGFAGGLERKRYLLNLENAELELTPIKMDQ